MNQLMSSGHDGFYLTNAGAKLLPELTDAQMRVLFELVRVSRDDGKSIEKQHRICARLELSKSCVMHAYKKLEALGFIERTDKWENKINRELIMSTDHEELGDPEIRNIYRDLEKIAMRRHHMKSGCEKW